MQTIIYAIYVIFVSPVHGGLVFTSSPPPPPTFELYYTRLWSYSHDVLHSTESLLVKTVCRHYKLTGT